MCVCVRIPTCCVSWTLLTIVSYFYANVISASLTVTSIVSSHRKQQRRSEVGEVCVCWHDFIFICWQNHCVISRKTSLSPGGINNMNVSLSCNKHFHLISVYSFSLIWTKMFYFIGKVIFHFVDKLKCKQSSCCCVKMQKGDRCV